MACLSVSLLGPLAVTLDGQPVSKFEYNKVKGLLAYLIGEADRPHRREALAGLLWPDQSQKAALDSLRNALSKLRLAINDRGADPAYLFINNDAIQFNSASDHKLDLAHFSQTLDAVSAHRHRRIESCTSCCERLKIAVGLYHGEFFEGFSLPDSNLFEDWILLRREKYYQLAQHALHQLAAIYEWRGEIQLALVYTRRQLELDPCRESAHLRAIRLLATQGMHAEACEQYEQCREYLANELGVDPAEETTLLYEQVKNGTFQAASAGRKRFNNLPPNLTSFVGRERELTEINALVDDPACRLLTLVGAGGVGKTRLAVAAARLQLDMFPDGACFVPLSGINALNYIVPTILKALDISPSPQGDLNEQLVNFLQEKELVLVLDNFEHLIEGANIITEILKRASQVMILVTSRQRLNLQAEWLYEVNGMSYPCSKDMRNLAAFDAVQLFTARLHQVKPQTTQFEDDLPMVARVCQLVEGLPLGIELAASAVRLRSLAQVSQAIESGQDDLSVSLRDVPERHRSLRAVFDHSWNLLNEQEQEVFSSLAVFRGGFTEQAAQQVARASLPNLATLVDHSMVRYNPAKERYDLHELVRQYALDKLKKQGREISMRQSHLEYFMQWAERIDPELHGPDQVKWLNCLDTDLENLRSALDWSLEFNPMDGMRLASALFIFWWRRNLNVEAAGRLIKYLDKPETKHPTTYRARALGLLISLGMHFTDSVEGWAKESLSICDTLQDDCDRAVTLWILGSAYHRMLNNNELAESYLLRSLEAFSVIGKRSEIADIYLELANVSMAVRGDAIAQRNYIEQALEIYRQEGDLHGIAHASDNLANVIIDIELDLNQGYRLVEEALKIFEQLNSRLSAHNALNIYANILAWQGHYQRAWEVMHERVEIIHQGIEPARIILADVLMARINRLIGREQEAFGVLEKNLRILEKPEMNWVAGRLMEFPLRELALIIARRGDTQLARAYIQKSMELVTWMEGIATLLQYRGTIALTELSGPDALADFQESLKICKTSYLGLTSILDIDGIAGSLYLLGEYKQAVKLLSAMSACRERIGAKVFPWDEPDYSKLIDNLQGVLGPSEYAKAWENGKGLSFDQAVDEALAINLA